MNHFILAYHPSGLLAAILDIDALVEMLSIGTLLAYTVVDICIIILRYKHFPGNYLFIYFFIYECLPRIASLNIMDLTAKVLASINKQIRTNKLYVSCLIIR